jgi:predicted dehydrogenase
MINLGLMGCGVVAGYGHLPAIASVSDLNLVAVFDPDPKRAEAAAREFGAGAWFTDCEAFFQSGVDAVTITSPAPFHRENVLSAAQYGKHVLCEKPLALGDDDAAEMIRVMRDAGLMLFTGFCYRFSPSALKVKELIESGAVGMPCSLRLIYNWNLHGKFESGADGEPRLNERRIGRMHEGGPMIDCGTHQIDLARWWLGSDVTQITGVGAWVDTYDVPDHIYLHLDHACGAHTMVEISYSYGFTSKQPRSEFVYEIIGDDGVIRYDREAQSFELRNSRGTEVFDWHPEKNFAQMYRAFAHALATGDPGHLPSGEDGLMATTIARRGTDDAVERRYRA